MGNNDYHKEQERTRRQAAQSRDSEIEGDVRLNRAYSGDLISIQDQVRQPPENGGFLDVVNNPDAFMEAAQNVENRLREGEKNDFSIYEDELGKVRQKYGTYSGVDPEEEARQGAIAEIIRNRTPESWMLEDE